MRILSERLFLADVAGSTDEEILNFLIREFCVTPEEVDKFNPIIAYVSEGNWGCDSSAFFLLQHCETGELFEVHGSHCSCHGYEDQFSPELTNLEYLQSDKFGFLCGGYDDDEDRNKQAVKDFLKSLKP